MPFTPKDESEADTSVTKDEIAPGEFTVKTSEVEE